MHTNGALTHGVPLVFSNGAPHVQCAISVHIIYSSFSSSVRNAIGNTIHVFCAKKKWFSKLLLNRLYFAKNLSWVMILGSIAFQRYIASPIWEMLGEVQPSTRGSSGRTTRAVKLQQRHVSSRPESKSANERDSYLKRAFSC